MTASWLQSGMAISRTGLKCSYHISLPRTEVESLNHRKLVRRGEIIKMVEVDGSEKGLDVVEANRNFPASRRDQPSVR
jgi:hypothetical protein